MRCDDNRRGYVPAQGYVFDTRSRRLAPVPGVWKATYDGVCASSAAIYFTPGDLPGPNEQQTGCYFDLFTRAG